jgi:hypothetical protein
MKKQCENKGKLRYGYLAGWTFACSTFLLWLMAFLTAYYSGITGRGYVAMISINNFHEAHIELILFAAALIFGGWFFIDTFRREVCNKR